MKLWKASAIVALCIAAGGCGSSGSSGVTVAINPPSATVPLQTTQQFSASVTGATDMSVMWQVNTVTGGNSTVGTISTNGLYTPPTAVPNPATVTITAISNANTHATAMATVLLVSNLTVTLSPGTPVTVGTGETFTFTATLTGTTSAMVDWFVNSTQGGSSTLGTVPMTTTGPTPASIMATYTAPTTVPTGGTVTFEAKAHVDPSRTASVTITIVAAANPTLTSITPTLIPQGAVFQDIYLTGTNFLSTSLVFVAGTQVPAANAVLLSSTVLRARIPASQLTAAGPLGVLVQRQLVGAPPPFTTQTITLTVQSERPALVSANPPSVMQSSGAVNFDLTGGFFGGASADFENGAIAPTFSPNTPQQLQVALGNAQLGKAGSFSVGVTNAAVSPGRSAVNLAVQPLSAPGAPQLVGAGILNQPNAVAVNTATGVAVVVNGGTSGVNANSVSLVSLASNTITNTIPVGTRPTAVAVDDERNLALVADNGSNDVDIVNLATNAVTTLTGIGTAPFGVGVDPVHGFALVANASSTLATVVDLKTLPPGSPAAAVCGMPAGSPVVCTQVNIDTGPSPSVAVLPELGWAIVTPGGNGAPTPMLSVVDLKRQSVVFTSSVSVAVQGIAVNTETRQMLLTNALSTSSAFTFSLLDQTVSLPVNLQVGAVAAAVNPLTNVGVVTNATTNTANVIDLSGPTLLTAVTVGANPQAVAVDPGSDTAIVANTSDNNLSIFTLGAASDFTTNPQILQVDPPLLFAANPPVAAPLTIIGSNFQAGAQILLDGTAIAPATATPRQLTAMIPTSFLNAARRIVVEVQNPGGATSNVGNIMVIQPVAVGMAPRAVAIDPQLDVAYITNSGDNTVTILDLSPGSVGSTISTVPLSPMGTNPQGVAVLARTGQAVVANEGTNNVSVITVAGTRPSLTASVTNTISTGSQPLGVAVDQDTGMAFVSNSASNSLSAFSASATGAVLPATVATCATPGAIAVAPDLGFLVLACEAGNSLEVFNISGATPAFTNLVQNQFTTNPTGAAYDPVQQVLIGLSSAGNALSIFNPTTNPITPTSARVGINPTSMAYNFQTSTLLTVNNSSNTISVMDFPNRTVRSLLDLANGTNFTGNMFAVDIHTRTNLAIVVDSTNNRILLMQMPR